MPEVRAIEWSNSNSGAKMRGNQVIISESKASAP